MDARSLYERALQPPGGAWSFDLRTEVLTWDSSVYDLFGLRPGTKLQRAATLDVYQSQSRSEMEARRAASIRAGRGFSLDCQIRPHGKNRWMRLRVGMEFGQGRAIRIFGSKHDISDEKAMWDGLVTLAGTDALTGLANRRAFENAMRALSQHAGGTHAFALAVLSIDDLDTVRARFDHAGAYEYAKAVAARLSRLFPDAILASRIGGGEFALLLSVLGGYLTLATTLESARHLLARPVLCGSCAIETGITLGASMMKPSHRHDPAKLFAEADAALFVAKAAGSNCVRIFDGMVAK
jgi:diguanylate cyclase (GGDEF)-like protein